MEDDTYESIFPLPLWAVLLIILFSWPSMLLADTYSMTDQNGKLTLTEKPCKLGPWFGEWKAADWMFQGKPYEACWRVQDRMIVIVDSSGVVSAVDPRAFRKDTGV